MAGEIKQLSDTDILKQAEILTLRQIGDTLKTVSNELIAHRKDLSDIKTDVAVMKVRQEQNQEMREIVKSLEAKVEALETRNHKEDGAITFLKFLKDFGPWLGLIVMSYLALFTRK